MTLAKKINGSNHLPSPGQDRFPVYSKKFNELVDIVNEKSTSGEIVITDTISEATEFAGVTIDGVWLIDGYIEASNGVAVDSLSSGFAYLTGASVTQVGSRSAGVALEALMGEIYTDTTSLAAGASAVFTVTNPAITIRDVIMVSIRSGSSNVAGTAGTTHVNVVTVANGSFKIAVDNQSTTTAETGAIIINFAVIGGYGPW